MTPTRKMWSSKHQLGTKNGSMIFIFFMSILVQGNANVSNKLDETPMPQVPNLGMKCTTCSCANPCDSQLPSPPPPPPPPPQPSSQYCGTPITPVPPPPPRFVYFTSPLPLEPPPPPPRFVYFTSPLPLEPPPPQRFVYFSGPPGNSYPTDPSDLVTFGGGTRSDVVCWPALLGFVLLQFFAFWLVL